MALFVFKFKGRIFKRKLEIEDNNGIEVEKPQKRFKKSLLDPEKKSHMQRKSYNQKENARLISNNVSCGDLMKEALLTDKKLCLVLDLDHTLLHSVRISDMSLDDQEYLRGRAALITVMKTVGRYNLYNHMDRYTRLRPYVRNFIEELHEKFELFVYTKGERWYAEEMVRLIDPKNVYFKNKVISKDDSTNRKQKNLDVVLGGFATNTIIIDDTECVWKENKDNLIRIKKFNYFSSGKHQLKRDDDEFNEDDDALKRILEILLSVHKKFFEDYPAETDVNNFWGNVFLGQHFGRDEKTSYLISTEIKAPQTCTARPMDLETENMIASILMREAVCCQADKEGVHTYLLQPNVRGRPNSRFLTATVHGVEQANQVVEMGEMWRVRQKEIINCEQNQETGAFIGTIAIVAHPPEKLRQLMEECNTGEDSTGLRDEEVEEFCT